MDNADVMKAKSAPEINVAPAFVKSSKRHSVATSDGRLALQKMENLAHRRVSLKSDVHHRASVATSDARLLEGRRSDDTSFLRRAEADAAVEQNFAQALPLKRARRATMALMGKKEEAADEEVAKDESDGQSLFEAVLNLLNNCLGSGMLAIAFCIAKAGIIPSFVFIFLSMAFNRTTLLQIMKTCKLAGCDASSATIGEIAVGAPGRLMLILSYTLLGYFCMVSYVNATTDALLSLVNLVTGSSADDPYYAQVGLTAGQFKIIVWALVLLPTTFVRSLKGAAVMSLISFAGAVLLAASILINCGGALLKDGLPPMEKINLWPKTEEDLLDQASVFLLLYSIQAGGGMILANLKDDTEAGMTRAVDMTFVIAFCLEVLIGLCGYFYFLDSTPGDLLVRFPDTDPVANVGRVAVLMLVVPGYMMMVNPCRMSIIQLLFDKNEALQEASYAEFIGVTLSIDFAALAMALTVEDLSMVFAVSGSFVTPFVAFILPAIFTLAIRSKVDEPNFVPLVSVRNMDMYIVLMFGLVSLLVFGSMTVKKLTGM